jgi:hypothetical protein
MTLDKDSSVEECQNFDFSLLVRRGISITTLVSENDTFGALVMVLVLYYQETKVVLLRTTK